MVQKAEMGMMGQPKDYLKRIAVRFGVGHAKGVVEDGAFPDRFGICGCCPDDDRRGPSGDCGGQWWNRKCGLGHAGRWQPMFNQVGLSDA